MPPSAAQLWNAFGAGIYLLFGVVHLDVWLRRRERLADLWLGCASLSALLVDGTGMYLDGLSGVPPAWALTLNDLGVAAATICLVRLVAALDGGPTAGAARVVQWAVLVISAIGSAVAPPLMALGHALCLLLLLGAMARAFRASRAGDREAGLVARGFIVLNACLVADLVQQLGIGPLVPGLPIAGFAVLFLVSARSLNARFVREHQELEALRLDLERRVEERTVALSAANALLADASRTDLLTGLPNRRGFLQEVEGAFERSRRSGRPVSLALADVDHFKRVNDTLGHAAGDHALACVAKAIRAAVRKQDVVARWGGEEFVVLLPETELPGALLLAEKVRAVVAALPVAFDGEPLALTVSFGVAERSPTGSFDATLGTADEALYRAKREGRDRVAASPAREPAGRHG